MSDIQLLLRFDLNDLVDFIKISLQIFLRFIHLTIYENDIPSGVTNNSTHIQLHKSADVLLFKRIDFK
jgi:hypothetical protein